MADKLISPQDGSRIPICSLFRETRLVFKPDNLGWEILSIALPSAMALTADPIASLVDTAFIGRIGAVELAAVGVSIALFNQISRIAIFPLVSVTTSFVAEEDALTAASPLVEESEYLEEGSNLKAETNELIQDKGGHAQKPDLIHVNTNVVKVEHKRRHIPSASSALVIGGILGLVQAIFLIFAAKPLLKFMGVTYDSPMLKPAQNYLTLRSLGAPAVLLSLAMQGVFRGFKDTKTPLYATLAGDLTNIALDPLFMFVFRLGVSGAAIAHVISQ
ncbi:Protein DETOXIFICATION 42 [Stylosanthes scabra]|uniref:Protein DETOXIFICATION 42 n=1 Tax=Stylosanthes scabra TaxID=79078 RepID=A0ABU6Z3U1_9FABA|nr:Protein DETOXIFICATION 42 [Stylosanthes scabra]